MLKLFSIRTSLIIVLLLSLLILSKDVQGHGGQIETGGGGGGPVHLTKTQQSAIGLKIANADIRDMSRVLSIKGVVKLDPSRQAFVTTRIEGRVNKLNVKLGDFVRAGQSLMDIQSRQFGDPPPIVPVPAPMSGVIDERNVVLGEAVNPEKNLLHIVNLSTVIVQAQVYEEDIGKVTLNQTARIHLLAYPEDTFTGKVTYLGQSVDPQKRTLPVWIAVNNTAGKIKPEMFANVAVVLSKSEGVLTVPKAAVLEEGGEKFVFVQEGEEFNRADIAAGLEDDLYVEVKDGLVPGDAVVTDGKREVYTSWLTGGPKSKSDKKQEKAQKH